MRRLLLLLLLAGCSAPERVQPGDAKPHYGPAWFAFRAGSLGISEEAAQARDRALSEEEPPPPDEVVRVEAAAIYRNACAACHGADGVPPPQERPPRTWGTTGTRMGFTFGGDDMRAGLYRTIRDGPAAKDGEAPRMPAWRGTLSREQTWGLVRHLESFAN